MLSTHLDQHLLTFGIWQQISHEIEAYDAEEHEEISLFVAITSLGKPDYRMLGVMQYTFNKAGECYHRAFKPLLKTHVRRLSNSKTQWILQAAIYDLIQEAQKKPCTPSAEVLASFLNTFDKDEADALNAVMREIEKLTGY